MRLNTFKPTKGHRNWCGPTALSILTGRTLGYCAKLCAEEASRRRLRWTYNKGVHSVHHTPKTIKGVNNDELQAAAYRMGFRFIYVPCTIHTEHGTQYKRGWSRKTLFKLMEEMGSSMWREALLINVTNHYVVAQRGVCYDNHDTTGTDSREFWCRKRKVQQVWIVERIK